jgi:hypothetical protein
MILKQWNIRIKIELMINPITVQLAQGIAKPPLSVALGVRLFWRFLFIFNSPYVT